jgi:hypothetical protein
MNISMCCFCCGNRDSKQVENTIFRILDLFLSSGEFRDILFGLFDRVNLSHCSELGFRVALRLALSKGPNRVGNKSSFLKALL